VQKLDFGPFRRLKHKYGFVNPLLPNVEVTGSVDYTTNIGKVVDKE
jgi:hypothetical protein